MIEGARSRGLDVSTEAYPYGAFAAGVNSAAFSEGWRERYGMDYGDIELPATGERLNQERFEQLHAATGSLQVIGHLNPPDVVDEIIAHPLVMIASDGQVEHPRGAGSFARVLARNVREQRSLLLIDAVRKMSLLPAQRLETVTAAARRKGRVQVGADADVVVFDSQRIEDRATFRAPLTPSVGVRYLLVAGTVVVDGGRTVEGVAPGQALLAEGSPLLPREKGSEGRAGFIGLQALTEQFALDRDALAQGIRVTHQTLGETQRLGGFERQGLGRSAGARYDLGGW